MRRKQRGKQRSLCWGLPGFPCSDPGSEGGMAACVERRGKLCCCNFSFLKSHPNNKSIFSTICSTSNITQRYCLAAGHAGRQETRAVKTKFERMSFPFFSSLS
ncbi:hypothetical protein OYC64_011877 [Pagothenia borchgrevinki]|uniref:Uncharacterized protein n=1 Tax=Pagothenia borchgrevinki TaxID=8213 RepID=A0ABD2FHB0_PAGBO